MQKLIKILRKAHAIEIGAYEAYEGHWRSLKDPEQKRRLKEIQKDEWFHKQAVGFMLIELGAESNKVLDFTMYCIGKIISMSCYVMGNKAAAWGAKLFEMMGSEIYRHAAYKASSMGNLPMYIELWKMKEEEEEHEEFFKWCLGYTETL